MNTCNALAPEMIKAQLARMIDSPSFRNAPRLSRFLSYVVEESLAGRPDRLKGYSIGLEVFDKSDGFDPQTDTIVRVQARALRQKIDHYYARDGMLDAVRIAIEKGSYEPSFSTVDETQQTTPAPSSRKPSIAVLPFDDFSEDGTGAAFSDGLTEEIIANLSRFKELSVFSRATTKKAKLDNLSIAQMYAAFRPDFVIEGSCRRNADMATITINLVVAAEEEVIATRHFTHVLTPEALYGAQDEIALLIAEQIADRFGPLDQYARRVGPVGRSVKWDTFRWISEYHKYAIQLCAIDREDIKAGLYSALQNDPACSDAHAALALIFLDEYRLSFEVNPSTLILDHALEKAQEAVRCDPDNAIAYEALAVTRFHRGEFELFEQGADRAMQLNPGHADMLAMIGICYAARMNWEKAMPLLDHAISLNPLQPGWFHIPKAIGLMMTGQVQAAIAEMLISPLTGVFFYHCHFAWFLTETNDFGAAIEQKEKLLEVFPNFEEVALRLCSAWRLDEAIIARAVAGWERLGLILSE